MNKKLQNGLVMAVSAAMGTGIVAPVIAAAATTGTSIDAQYKAAYDATVKATASKSQADLTAARVLVDGLYQVVKGTPNEYLATTLSQLLDPAQQVKLVELFTAIDKADASVTQTDINAARNLILAMPAQWINTFSSRIDTIQQKLIVKVNDAVVKAEGSGLAADKTAAQALVADIKTVTNNADVLTWANAMGVRADAVVTSLQVSSVSAINATQAKVVFTQAVAGGTNLNANLNTNYSIGGVNPSTAVLQSDKKTVILTFADATTLTAYNGTTNSGVTNVAVIIEPIQSAADALVSSPRYATVLSYKDTVKPAISSITSSTNSSVTPTVTVKFTEPVSSLGSVKIDNSGVVGALAIDGLSATFTINLDATTGHTIQFLGLTDKAGNVADLFTNSFNITVDQAAPTVTVAPSTDVDNAFTLTFNKDMNAGSVTSATITVADEILGADFGTVSISQPDLTNNKVFLVTGTNVAKMFANKTTRTFTAVLPGTMTDSLGNAFTAKTVNVTLTKDTVKPTITGVKVLKDAAGKVTSIVISSSSTLSAASLTGLSIVDSNGVLCTGTTALGALTVSAVTAGDNTVTILPTTSAALTGKYTFNFASGTLSDQAETANTSAAVSQVVDFGTAATGSGTFTIPAANVAQVTPVPVTNPQGINPTLQATLTSNVYKVDFGTAVKGGAVAGSATDLSRYTINGNALPAGTTITLDTAKQVATITVPTGTIAATDTAAVLYIAGVQDLNGNAVVPVTTAIQINDNIAPVLNSAVLNADGTISIGFSNSISGLPAYTTDIIVTLNGSAVTGTIVAGSGLNAGKDVLTITQLKGDALGVYVDVDNSGTRNTGDTAVTSLKVSTATNPSAADAAGNALVGSTTITIK